MWWILLWILTFIILIILHEFWHFTAAKKSWVHVKEFWLGLPPRIKTLWKDKSWTEYTLNRIPLGWFVSLKWEDSTDETENKDIDSFWKAKLWKKLIIILAGVTMNFLTAWVLFTIAFTIGMSPMAVLPDDFKGLYSESYVTPSVSFLQQQGLMSGSSEAAEVQVNQVISWSLAENIGLQEWSIIETINGVSITTENLPEQLAGLSKSTNNEIIFHAKDSDTQQISTFDCEENCKLWIMYSQWWNYEILPIKFSFWRAMLVSLHEIKAEWDLTMLSLANIGKMIWAGNTKEALSSLSWPIAIVKVWENIFETLGLLSFLWFAGMLSVALAIMNVLPIPALDGWRFWALIIQKIFRIKDENFSLVEGWVNTVFFRIIIILWILIMIKDLSYWWINIPFFS